MSVNQMRMYFNMSILDHLVHAFRNATIVKVVLVSIGLLQLISLVFAFMTVYLDHLNIWFSDPPLFIDRPGWSRFITGVVIAPVIETYIFQVIIYKVLRRSRFFRHNVRYIILVSAFLFGIAHCYHLFYMIGIFLSGIVFMAAYLSKLDDKKKAFWLVVLIHALANAMTISFFLLSESFLT